jgi:hypothetical protein
MYEYVCVYVCIHARIHVGMHVCMYACMYVCVSYESHKNQRLCLYKASDWVLQASLGVFLEG